MNPDVTRRSLRSIEKLAKQLKVVSRSHDHGEFPTRSGLNFRFFFVRIRAYCASIAPRSNYLFVTETLLGGGQSTQPAPLLVACSTHSPVLL